MFNRTINADKNIGSLEYTRYSLTDPLVDSSKNILEKWMTSIKSMDPDDYSSCLFPSIIAHFVEVFPTIVEFSTDEPWSVKVDDAKFDDEIIRPLRQLILKTTENITFKQFGEALGLNSVALKPGQICGHVFRSAEMTYSCTECATDPTCVMCHRCFEESAHKSHAHTMHASGGNGYCDCGDLEAWSNDPYCGLHQPCETADNMEVDGDSVADVLPPDLKAHIISLCRLLLAHLINLLLWTDYTIYPPLLAKLVGTENQSFHAILLNDESHTYESVIKALERTIACTREQATLIASIVDREGRASVRTGSKDWCQKAESDIVKWTAKSMNANTDKRGPLTVAIVPHTLAVHQFFAQKLLNWLALSARELAPLRYIISEILLEQRTDAYPLVVDLMTSESSLCKGARATSSMLIMSTCLADPDHKARFAFLFASDYELLMKSFIDDDCEHANSIVALTVQIFTVTTLARRLIAERNILESMYRFLTNFLRKFKDVKTNTLNFQAKSYPPVLRRAISIIDDTKYLLIQAPTRDEWTEELRRGFLDGLTMILSVTTMIDDMDAVQRVIGDPHEYDKEWETGLNLQIHLQHVYHSIVQWAKSDPVVLNNAISMCFKHVAATWQRNSGDEPIIEISAVAFSNLAHDWHQYSRKISFLNGEVEKDAMVSVHQPTRRLLSSLINAAVTGDAGASNEVPFHTFDDIAHRLHIELRRTESNDTVTQEDVNIDATGYAQCVLQESSLRVVAMCAQVQADMWKRNGYSLFNQNHNYTTPLCRIEMFDKDILTLQNAAAMMPPDDFIARLAHKFGLYDFWQFDERAFFGRIDLLNENRELSKRFVSVAEEMLHLLIILLAERYAGIGFCTHIDYLRRECAHLLFAGPMPFSKLQKKMANELKIDKQPLETIVEFVADFKQPSISSPGQFHIKDECLSMFNPFFWHYTKGQMSEAEKYQREQRRSSKMQHFKSLHPPVKVPPMHSAYKNLLKLFDCWSLAHLCVTALVRFATSLRGGSYALAHRAAYLIAMAFNEEYEPSSPAVYIPKFSKTLIEYCNFMLLSNDDVRQYILVRGLHQQSASLIRALQGENLHKNNRQLAIFDLFAKVTKNDQATGGLKELIEYCDEILFRIICKETPKLATVLRPSPEQKLATDTEQAQKQESEEEARARKKKIAAEKRKIAEEQMKRMQQNLLKNNKEFAELSQETLDIEHDDIEAANILGLVDVFPIAAGPDAHPLDLDNMKSKRLMCPLCQVTETITWNMENPMVYAALIQRSSLFAAHLQQPDLARLPLTIDQHEPAHLKMPLHVSSCGHAMHYNCASELLVAQTEKERRRQRGAFMLTKKMLNIGEYQCALCKRLCNALLPIIPAIIKQDCINDSNERTPKNENLTSSMLAVEKSSVKKKSKSKSPPQRKKNNKMRTRSMGLCDVEMEESEDIMSIGESSHSDVFASNVALTFDSDYDRWLDKIRYWMTEAAGNSLTSSEKKKFEESINIIRTISRKMKTGIRDRPTITFTSDTELDDGNIGQQRRQQAQRQRAVSTTDQQSSIRQILPQNVFQILSTFIHGKRDSENDDALEEALLYHSYPPAYCIMLNAFPYALQKSMKCRMMKKIDQSDAVYLNIASDQPTTSRAIVEQSEQRWIKPDVLPPIESDRMLTQRACAYTLRCLIAELDADHKPLFGAWSSRQQSTLYSLSRCAALDLRREIFHHDDRSMLFYCLMKPLFNRKWADPMDVDAISFMICLLSLTSSIYSDMFEQHAILVRHCVKLAAQLYLYQCLVSGARHAEHQLIGDVISEMSAHDRQMQQQLSTFLVDKLHCRPSGDHKSDKAIAYRCLSGLRQILEVATLYVHATSAVPPPDALKDPSIDTLPLCARYLGLPGNEQQLLSDLLKQEELFTRWHAFTLDNKSDIFINKSLVEQPLHVNKIIESNLPDNYAVLVARSAEFGCPLLRTDDSNRSPSMCLHCGALLCSQAYCCQRPLYAVNSNIDCLMRSAHGLNFDAPSSDKMEKMIAGACNYHMIDCTGDEGAMFLRLRDAKLLILASSQRGCFLPAPYVDQYGETDEGFHRGRALHLSKHLLKQLQRMWLHHTLQETVMNRYDTDQRNLIYDFLYY